MGDKNREQEVASSASDRKPSLETNQSAAQQDAASSSFVDTHLPVYSPSEVPNQPPSYQVPEPNNTPAPSQRQDSSSRSNLIYSSPPTYKASEASPRPPTDHYNGNYSAKRQGASFLRENASAASISAVMGPAPPDKKLTFAERWKRMKADRQAREEDRRNMAHSTGKRRDMGSSNKWNVTQL